MHHERKYLHKVKSDRNDRDVDKRERAKHDKDLEFDDYRKSMREGVKPKSPNRGEKRKGLNKIVEEEGSSEESPKNDNI